MFILFFTAGFLEVTIFLFAVTAFVLAVRFFMDSRKRLEETFPGLLRSRKLLSYGFDRNGFVIPKTVPRKTVVKDVAAGNTSRFMPVPDTREEMNELRQQLKQQQLELAKALEKITFISQEEAQPATEPSSVLEEQTKLEGLRIQLGKKEAEIQRLHGQEMYSQKLQQQLEEVQLAFDELQEKMQQMEKQAWEAAELNIQLEHAEQAQLQTEKTLYKKEEKLRELSLENQRLHEACNELEDKLSEANLQRQQLTKKVQLLESFNADMMQMAEANRKLKTEMARVAELESMLSLMTDGKSR